MKKLWDLKKGFSNLKLEEHGQGIIMGVTRLLLLGPFYTIQTKTDQTFWRGVYYCISRTRVITVKTCLLLRNIFFFKKSSFALIGNFKPSFIKKDKDKNKSNSSSSGANIAGAGPAGAKVIKNDLASRTSPLPSAPPTSETERFERLRIQEEQDLTYAIALSRAEAASVNN